MTRRSWKHVQPTSLRHALELCKDYARERRNLSVERIAERMGEVDHWNLYKWLSSARMPLSLIRAYEETCGIDFVTRYLAVSAGKLLIEMRIGRTPSAQDIHALQETLNTAVGQILAFHAGRVEATEALAAIQCGMEALGYHHRNVQKHGQPELSFHGDEP